MLKEVCNTSQQILYKLTTYILNQSLPVFLQTNMTHHACNRQTIFFKFSYCSINIFLFSAANNNFRSIGSKSLSDSQSNPKELRITMSIL